MMKKVDITSLNDKKYSLIQFAVAGGSIEIIHLLAQQHCSMLCAIPIAIESYQLEILEYLLDNFFPKSEQDFASMDYSKRQDREDDIIKNKITFELDEYNDFDVFYKDIKSPHFVRILNDEEDNQNFEEVDLGKFEYFNFDVVFNSILESNNYLALFILFNRDMNINVQERKSKRTLLHYAIRKGKVFLVQLLLSNKNINPALKDAKGESPIVYSVKYCRTDIFFIMIKDDKVLNSLNSSEYIKLAQYAEICKLNEVKDYLMNHWDIDLVSLIDSYDIRSFANIVYAAPFYYIENQYFKAIEKAFIESHFHQFSMLLNRHVQNIDFYYKKSQEDDANNSNNPSITDILAYYRYDPNGFSFYQLYKQMPNKHLHYIWHRIGFDPRYGDPFCEISMMKYFDCDEFSYMFYRIHRSKKDPYIEQRKEEK